MTRLLLRTLLPAAGLLVTAGAAAAQNPYPYPPSAYGPTPGGQPGSPLSPYLNLVNGPSSLPGVNYYNFVRPNLQLQQQQQIYGGGMPLVSLDQYPLATDIRMDPTGPLPRSSGLPATFMNYGGYFNTMGTIGTVTYRGGAAGAGRAPAPTTGVPSVPRR